MLQLDKIKKVIDNKKPKTSDASQKVILNKLLNSNMPIDHKTAIEILKSVSAKTGVDLPFLAANAMQEGMNKAIVASDDKMQNYGKDYPVSGYTFYGLDTFGDAAGRLKEKGYLPENLDYITWGTKNEKGENINTASFKNNEDALMAKAAYLKEFRDNVLNYAKKKNLKLEDDTEKYMIMSAYNGGMGNAMKMMDELATGKYNQRDYVQQGLTSRQGVHKHIAPRMENMMMINKLTSGPVAPYRRPSYDIFKLFDKKK